MSTYIIYAYTCIDIYLQVINVIVQCKKGDDFLKIHLKEILDSKNISVYSLSKEIGIAPNNLSKIVKGETSSIRYDILENICNALNITPNDIFELEEPNASSTYQAWMLRFKSDNKLFTQMKTIATQYNPDIEFMNIDEQLKFVINFILNNEF